MYVDSGLLLYETERGHSVMSSCGGRVYLRSEEVVSTHTHTHTSQDAGDILDLSWHSSGQRFVTSHRNGSVAHWNVDQPAQPYLVKQLHGTHLVVVTCTW